MYAWTHAHSNTCISIYTHTYMHIYRYMYIFLLNKPCRSGRPLQKKYGEPRKVSSNKKIQQPNLQMASGLLPKGAVSAFRAPEWADPLSGFDSGINRDLWFGVRSYPHCKGQCRSECPYVSDITSHALLSVPLHCAYTPSSTPSSETAGV